MRRLQLYNNPLRSPRARLRNKAHLRPQLPPPPSPRRNACPARKAERATSGSREAPRGQRRAAAPYAGTRRSASWDSESCRSSGTIRSRCSGCPGRPRVPEQWTSSRSACGNAGVAGYATDYHHPIACSAAKRCYTNRCGNTSRRRRSDGRFP